jgi:SNF family Na+-dependent transporter
MITLILTLAVSLSVLWVWIVNSKPVQKEFERFNLGSVTMIWVGLAKIVLSVLMLVGLFSTSLLLISSFLMGLLMVAAQYYHIKYDSPVTKRLPSILLLVCCIIIGYLVKLS